MDSWPAHIPTGPARTIPPMKTTKNKNAPVKAILGLAISLFTAAAVAAGGTPASTNIAAPAAITAASVPAPDLAEPFDIFPSGSSPTAAITTTTTPVESEPKTIIKAIEKALPDLPGGLQSQVLSAGLIAPTTVASTTTTAAPITTTTAAPTTTAPITTTTAAPAPATGFADQEQQWMQGYLDQGGRNLNAFQNIILPCESGGENNPHAAVGRTDDHGRAQINRPVWKNRFEQKFGVPFDTHIYDPYLNGAMAATVEHEHHGIHGGGLNAWTCWRNR